MAVVVVVVVVGAVVGAVVGVGVACMRLLFVRAFFDHVRYLRRR